MTSAVLITQPITQPSAQKSVDADDEQTRREAGRLGMWIFLATELLFFGGLLIGYLYGRSTWPQGFALASRHTDVLLGTINTAVLLTSSALMALAVEFAEDESGRGRRWTARLLALTALLGVVFLVVKGFEYRKEWLEGLFPGPHFSLAATTGAELFFMLYVVMTALHGVHLVIGVCVITVLAIARHRGSGLAKASHIEVAGLYWHFVDVVWIFLYPLIYLVSRHS